MHPPCRVRILPEETVNRVAAGEVIERPAAALKELLENSLDAGAEHVDVELARAGVGLIVVTDDGAGMSQDDLVLALERHATSKIASVEDLARVATFGFRGEALPSIAAVSRLRVETRRRGAAAGARLEADGGRILRVTPCGCPEGTRVEVRELFHSVPARLKFLRSEATELGHCLQIATRLALACPARGVRLRHGGRELLRLAPSSDAGGRIRDYLGRGFTAGLIPVRAAGEACAVSGFVSRPGAGRAGAEYQQLFVNGRPVRDAQLAHGLREACRDHFLQEKNGVSYFLWLAVADGGVDVNVHPTKREVRFREPAAVLAVVGAGLREALRVDRSLCLPVPDRARAWSGVSPPRPAPAASEPQQAAEPRLPGAYLVTPDLQPRLPLGLPTPGAAATPGDAPTRDPIQLCETYIVCTGPEGLVLLDQHAAHERVLYERYLSRGSGEACQQVLEPLVFEVAPAEETVLPGLVGALRELGIAVEAIGPRSWRVLGLPAELVPAEAVGFIREVTALALDGLIPARVEQFRHRAAALLACHTAIRARQSLAPAQVAALLEQLSRTENPNACPHGRPTSITIDRVEIERRFKRT